MRFSIVTGVVALVAGACAATIKLPIKSRTLDRLSTRPGRSVSEIQTPLDANYPSHHGELKNDGKAIANGYDYVYTTNISIGTPPQQLSVVLHTGSDIFLVPSTPRSEFFAPEHYYNSSQSSSYHENGTRASASWYGVAYDGYVSSDTVNIAGIALNEYSFEEWTDSTCVLIGCRRFGFDGVLGLAPPWTSKRDPPGVLVWMQSHDLLDSNMYSMKLPRNDDDTGEFLLGDVNHDLFEDELVWLPWYDVEDRPGYLEGVWTVSVESVTFNTSIPIHYDIPPSPKSYAILDSALPYIVLPGELAKNFTEAVGAREGPPIMEPFWHFYLPCERRQELPTLTIGLSGHNFSVSAFDYIMEIDVPGLGRTCLAVFEKSEDYPLPNAMALGSPFLRGLYNVFDLDNRRIGFGKLKA